MKKTIILFMIAGAFALLISLSTSASHYRIDENADSNIALDTTEFRNTVMLPSDGVNWAYDLDLSVKYPEAALSQRIEGEVVVLCTVDTDGSVSDVKILKDIGGGAGLEVANAVRKLKFNPAVQNGYATKYTMAIPVVFDLE